jgi:hypothetical protein
VTALSVGTAFAQEGATGAGRIEVGAFPVGGIFFGNGDKANEPNFGNYALGATVAVNANKWIGFEGEIGGAVGIRPEYDVQRQQADESGHTACSRTTAISSRMWLAAIAWSRHMWRQASAV